MQFYAQQIEGIHKALKGGNPLFNLLFSFGNA